MRADQIVLKGVFASMQVNTIPALPTADEVNAELLAAATLALTAMRDPIVLIDKPAVADRITSALRNAITNAARLA